MVILKLSTVFLLIGLIGKNTVKGEPESRALQTKGDSCSMTLDIIIILDSSGSVGKHIWPQEVEFAKNLVKKLVVSQKDTHVGVIDFSFKSIVRVDMNKPEGYTPDSIQQALDYLKTQYQRSVTYTDLALASAVQMYNEIPANRHARKMLIIVTDGKATSRRHQTGLELMRDEIESLKLLNVNRIAIGVGGDVKRSELDFIASSRSNVILESNFKALLDDITRILITLCKPAPAPAMYYISLSFINSGPGVVVKWTQNGNPKELNIPSGYTYQQSISFESATQPSAMQFRIYEAGTQKVVKHFQVTPTLRHVEAKVIKIGQAPAMYYINLSYINSGPSVVVKWTQNGNPKELNIPSGYTYQQSIRFQSATQPSAMQFRIYEAGTQKVVKSFHVTPTLQRGEAKVIKIGQAPAMHYIKLKFVNSGPSVVAKWTQNGNPKELHIPSGYTYQQSISFESATPPTAMQFRIYEAGTNNVVKRFYVTPTLQQGEAKVIKIGQAPAMHYINLSFANSGPSVVVKWTQNGNPKQMYIPAGYTYQKSISFQSASQPRAMQFRIYESGTNKVVKRFYVTPTLQQGEAKVIKIGQAPAMYYINLRFINSGRSVVVKWTQNGNPKELNIPSGYTYRQSIRFESATQPSAMQFRIYDAGTNKVVKSFHVTPTLQQREAKVIKIGPAPAMYYINLSFINSGPGVVVKWTQNGNPKELNIPSGYTYQQSINFESATQPSAMQFRIYEAGTQKVVKSFHVTPTKRQGNAKVIKIGQAPAMYYINLSFVNSGPNVVVKWTQDGKPQELNIPSGYAYQQSISFQSATQPPAMQFRIYEAGTERVVKYFQATPTLRQGKAKLIKIGQGLAMYYIKLKFVNSGPSVVVKWTQNGNPREINIPSGYSYRQSFTFQAVTQPSALQFRIYEAGTQRLVKYFNVTPTRQREVKVIKIGPGHKRF